MDRNTLSYLADFLSQDSSAVFLAIANGENVSDEELKRVINTKLDALKADIANIQHFIETN